jgi:RNA polymerase sigma-70 factor (ECF subfamily)
MAQRTEDLDDVTLIARVASGDRAAFSALVERHWAPMYRFASHSARDAAAAEDALQETFAAVWRSAGTFRGEAGARGWLYAIARRALGREVAARKDAPEPLEAIGELGEAAGWGDAAAGPCVLAALEDRDHVRKALAALAEPDREVIVLCDVEELTNDEAAAALDVGVAALKSRLHRARLRLLAELRKEGDDAR